MKTLKPLGENQFSAGFSAWSITRASAGPLVAFSLLESGEDRRDRYVRRKCILCIVHIEQPRKLGLILRRSRPNRASIPLLKSGYAFVTLPDFWLNGE